MARRLTMRKLAYCLALSTIAAASAWAQPTESAAPQSARQALMEMFSGKQGSFVKHLPATTMAALEKAGALATMQQYSALAGHLQSQKAQGASFETFETGQVMLAADDGKGQKFEVVVMNDSLHGDEDGVRNLEAERDSVHGSGAAGRPGFPQEDQRRNQVAQRGSFANVDHDPGIARTERDNAKLYDAKLAGPAHDYFR